MTYPNPTIITGSAAPLRLGGTGGDHRYGTLAVSDADRAMLIQSHGGPTRFSADRVLLNNIYRDPKKNAGEGFMVEKGTHPVTVDIGDLIAENCHNPLKVWCTKQLDSLTVNRIVAVNCTNIWFNYWVTAPGYLADEYQPVHWGPIIINDLIACTPLDLIIGWKDQKPAPIYGYARVRGKCNVKNYCPDTFIVERI